MKIVAIILIIIGFFYIFTMGNDNAPEMTVNIAAGTVVHNDTTYTMSLEDDRVYRGHVRNVIEKPMRFAPFITHEFLLTTGDYSDASKVTVDGSDMSWQSSEKLTGSAARIQIVPANDGVFLKLSSIETDSDIKLTGSKVTNGVITYDDGLPFFESSEPIFIVTGVRRY